MIEESNEHSHSVMLKKDANYVKRVNYFNTEVKNEKLAKRSKTF